MVDRLVVGIFHWAVVVVHWAVGFVRKAGLQWVEATNYEVVDRANNFGFSSEIDRGTNSAREIEFDRGNDRGRDCVRESDREREKGEDGGFGSVCRAERRGCWSCWEKRNRIIFIKLVW